MTVFHRVDTRRPGFRLKAGMTEEGNTVDGEEHVTCRIQACEGDTLTPAAAPARSIAGYAFPA